MDVFGIYTDYDFPIQLNDQFMVKYYPNNPSINKIIWNKPIGNTLSDILFNANVALVTNNHIRPNEMETGICMINKIYKEYGFESIKMVLNNEPIILKISDQRVEVGYNILYSSCQ